MNGQPDGLSEILARINRTYETGFESLQLEHKTLEVLDIKNMPAHLDRLIASRAIKQPLRDLPLWAKVWPASFILGRFLRKYEPEGKTLLELGCGMGVLSLVASQYGFKHICATDIAPQALDFARANVLHNDLASIISVKRLDLLHSGSFQEKFDLIAAAEILYLDELHRPLLGFLQKALAPGGKAFFCTDMVRSKPRFQKLASRTFQVQEGKIGVKSPEQRIYSILILEKHDRETA